MNNDVLYILEYKLCTFVKFISTKFVIVDATVSKVVFLSLFSDCSLVVRRNTDNFCILILYHVTLTCVLVLTVFFIGFLRIFCS